MFSVRILVDQVGLENEVGERADRLRGHFLPDHRRQRLGGPGLIELTEYIHRAELSDKTGPPTHDRPSTP